MVNSIAGQFNSVEMLQYIFPSCVQWLLGQP